MKMKPPLRNLLIAASTLALSSFPLHAATINLDLTTNNPGPITLDPGSNTFSYTSFGINYLIVGGGGAGGTTSTGTGTDAGGGGGAGGLLTGTTNIAGVNTIAVGAGGAVNTGNGGKGGDGVNSSAFTLTAIGGGGGGWAGQAPGSGGSGGGAGSRGSADGGIGGLGEAGQGNNGGSRAVTGTRGGASGGGAGGAGNDNTATTTGATGGLGLSSSITGVSTTYAAGGDGGSGGVGAPGADASDNTGGGGAGGGGSGSQRGGAGGSGIVIVSYTGPQVLTGGLVSTVGGDTVHQFLDTGTNTLGFNATIAGNISGSGDLDWNGGGTLTLSGTNTYSGTTSVAFGNTLILNGDNSGATGAIDVAGTLAFGPSFDNTNIPAALGRVVTTSTGTVAVDNHAAFNFDFATLGLTAAYLGSVGDFSYTGTLTPQGTTYRLGGGGGTLTMANANAITGANSLIVRENVVLPVANNHDGGTTLNADSTLTLGNNGSLGSGTFTIAGASTIQASGTVNAPNPVSANANFTIGGTGTLTLGGDMTLNANRVITNSNTTNTTSFGAISGNTRTLTINGDGSTTVSGNITTTTGTLTKNNAGILTLGGANTNSGLTTVNGGTLVLSGSNSSAGATTLNAGTLQLNSASNGGLASGLLTTNDNADVIQAINADRAISNNMSLGNNTTISGSQSLTVNGTVNLKNGTTTLTNDISGTDKLLTLSSNIFGAAARNLELGGTGDTTVNGTLSLLTGTFTKSGNGTVILTNDNTYTGTTTVNGGTLRFSGSNSSAGNTTIGGNGGTLQLDSDTNGGLASGDLNLNANPGVVQTIQADRVITNNLIVQSNPTFSGDYSLTTGNLRVNNADRTITNNIASGKSLTLASIDRDGTNNRNLTLEGTGTTRVPGNIALGTGVVSVNGGTFIVNGISATGDFNINNTATLSGTGTIGSNVNLTMNANIAPGDGIGTLSVGGNFNLFSFGTGTGKLVFNLGPIAASDRINVTGQLDIGGLDAESGTLGISDFTFTNAGGVQAGTYTLITSSDLLGFLDTTDLTGTVAGFDATLQLNGTNVELVLAGESGGSPYDTWAAINAPSGTPDDDFDGDGVPNAIEFVLGGLATTNDLSKLPTVATSATNMTFTFVRDQASVGSGTSTVIEIGSDLATWPATFTVGADTASSSTGVSVTDNNNGTDTIILTITQAPDDKKFARLKVTITP